MAASVRKSPSTKPLKPTRFDLEGVQGSAHITAFLSEVYNLYRASLLNEKYYARKLSWMKCIKLSIDITIAISLGGGASGLVISNGISGWLVNTYLWFLWPIITLSGAVLLAVRRSLPIKQKIKLYSRFHDGHKDNYLGLKNLVNRINIEHGFSRDMEKTYQEIDKTYRKLESKDTTQRTNTRLIKRLEVKVDAKIPSETLWWPER
jgi:hypothetical protein